MVFYFEIIQIYKIISQKIYTNLVSQNIILIIC